MGSIPITRSNFFGLARQVEALGVVKPDCIDLAHIAQVVEHSLGKGEVTGSSPVVGTIFNGHFNFFYNLTAVDFGDWHVQGKI